MNVQTRTQRITLVVVLAAALIIGIVYAFTHDFGKQTGDPAALTPEQKQQVLESLQPSKPGSSELTPEQKKALTTMGTVGTTTPKQSSNSATQEKSILESLQGN